MAHVPQAKREQEGEEEKEERYIILIDSTAHL